MRWALLALMPAMLGSGACGKTRDASSAAVTAQLLTAAPNSTPTASFWAWFQENAQGLHAEKDLQRAMEVISNALAKVHPGVFAEIGESRESRQLVISVDGKTELFPVVQEIYAARP